MKMKLLGYVYNFLCDPVIRLGYLNKMGFYRLMSDEVYLKKEYFLNFGKELDLENPKSFNEKIQWLKIHDRKPIYTTMVDKYAAKEYVAGLIGEEFIIPLLGVWDTPDQIEFDALPQQFVLKTTHDSGGVIICRDKEKLNIKETKKKLWKSLHRNYYLAHREWPYKDVPRRIIAEKYMEDHSADSSKFIQTSNGGGKKEQLYHDNEKELCILNRTAIKEYKIFCFDGIAKMILVCCGTAHGSGRTNDYCDLGLNRLPFTSLNPNSIGDLEYPPQMDKMIKLAEKLAKGIPQVRVDMYLCDEHIYFGEMTLYHNAGLCQIEPYEWDMKLGGWIKLPDRRA